MDMQTYPFMIKRFEVTTLPLNPWQSFDLHVKAERAGPVIAGYDDQQKKELKVEFKRKKIPGQQA